jgi:hypothetical protein
VADKKEADTDLKVVEDSLEEGLSLDFAALVGATGVGQAIDRVAEEFFDGVEGGAPTGGGRFFGHCRPGGRAFDAICPVNTAPHTAMHAFHARPAPADRAKNRRHQRAPLAATNQPRPGLHSAPKGPQTVLGAGCVPAAVHFLLQVMAPFGVRVPKRCDLFKRRSSIWS